MGLHLSSPCSVGPARTSKKFRAVFSTVGPFDLSINEMVCWCDHGRNSSPQARTFLLPAFAGLTEDASTSPSTFRAKQPLPLRSLPKGFAHRHQIRSWRIP